MLKTIKIISSISILCFSATLLSSCTLFKERIILPIDTNIETTCCQECLEFVAGTPAAEKCLDNPGIKNECRELFEKNSAKDKECLAGKIVTLPDVVIPSQPDGAISPEQERANQENAQYYEFKKNMKIKNGAEL